MWKDHLLPTPRKPGSGPGRWPRPPVRVWIWTAVVVVLVVVAALLWRGSAAAATDHTTAGAPQTPSGSPAATLAQRWSAAGDPVPDNVLAGDRVVIGTPHGIRALDPATGREAWHYTRSDARMCGLTVTDGVAVAVFRAADRCDEAVALTAATGAYAWTRTLDLRGDATLSSAPQTVLAASPTELLTIDPTGDNIRWRYRAADGCRLVDERPGPDGVAVLERCTGSAAPQLRLLDAFAGTVRWSSATDFPPDAPVRLAGVGELIAVAGADSVQLLSGGDGHPVTVVASAGKPASAAETVVGGVALVWQAGTLSAVDAGGGQLWQRPALGLPAPGGKSLDGVVAVLVPEDGGFVRRDVRTGSELGRSAVAGVPAGGAASQVGPLLVYRLTDRVLGYG